MIPGPYLYAGAALALFVGGALLGYDYASSKCKAAALERAELIAEVRRANLQLADGIATRTEAAIGQIRIENTTINREVRHEREIHREVLENPDCAIPRSTLLLLNRARGVGGDDQRSAGEPGGAVPAAGGAPGREAAPPR